MSERQEELEARRNALIAQSAAQREQLQAMALDIKDRLAGIDRGIEVARSIARKPTVIAGAIAFVSFVGPRRILRAVSQSAMFITTGRQLVGMFRSSKEKANAPGSLIAVSGQGEDGASPSQGQPRLEQT